MADESPAAAAPSPAASQAPSGDTSPAPIEGGAPTAQGGEAATPEALPGETKADTVKRLNGIAKRNKAVREGQEALRREREQFAQEKASFSQRESALREFEAVKADPSKLFEFAARNGVSIDKAIEAFDRAQDPNARQEMEQKKLRDAEESRLKALEDKLAEQDRLTRQRQEAQAVSEYHQVFEDKSKFEAARLLYSREERLRIGDDIARRAHAKGLDPNLKSIAEAVEIRARQDERWLDYSGARAGATASLEAPTVAPPGTPTAPSGTRAKATLTATDASERARVNEDLSGLPLDERIRRSSLKGSGGR